MRKKRANGKGYGRHLWKVEDLVLRMYRVSPDDAKVYGVLFAKLRRDDGVGKLIKVRAAGLMKVTHA